MYSFRASHAVLFNHGISYESEFHAVQTVEGRCLYLDIDFCRRVASAFKHRFDLDYDDEQDLLPIDYFGPF